MQRFTEDDFGLTWLMGAFHLDWTNYARSEGEALRLELWDGLDPRHVMLLRRDAALLLRLPSASIEQLWEAGLEGWKFFGARISSGAEWMRLIIEECDAWLSRSKTVPLNDADQEDGFDYADAVLSELREAVDLLGIDLVSILSQCARSCTPELAFRLLLQALMRRGKRITQDRYERLKEIGADLHYGEFLVSKVEHLVEGY